MLEIEIIDGVAYYVGTDIAPDLSQYAARGRTAVHPKHGLGVMGASCDGNVYDQPRSAASATLVPEADKSQPQT